MLTWQPNPSDPEVFHITHVGNLPSIYASGLVCDAAIASGGVSPVTIGSSTIKQRRLHWTLNLPDRPCVGDFVPFYFCPRSVMLYKIWQGHISWGGGQNEIVHLVSRVSRLRAFGRRMIFTDRNAATAYHFASEDLGALATTIDWSAMPLTQWSGPPKVARQAELLVEAQVPWPAVERIVVRDPRVQNVVGAVLSGAPAPRVDVDRTWYYP